MYLGITDDNIVGLCVASGIIDIVTNNSGTPPENSLNLLTNKTSIFGVISVFLSLVANVWAVSLVSIKTWWVVSTFQTLLIVCQRNACRRYQRVTKTLKNGRYSLRGILLVLVEFGVLYCLFLVIIEELLFIVLSLLCLLFRLLFSS
jgi:hypothetical protein